MLKLHHILAISLVIAFYSLQAFGVIRIASLDNVPVFGKIWFCLIYTKDDFVPSTDFLGLRFRTKQYVTQYLDIFPAEMESHLLNHTSYRAEDYIGHDHYHEDCQVTSNEMVLMASFRLGQYGEENTYTGFFLYWKRNPSQPTFVEYKVHALFGDIDPQQHSCTNNFDIKGIKTLTTAYLNFQHLYEVSLSTNFDQWCLDHNATIIEFGVELTIYQNPYQWLIAGDLPVYREFVQNSTTITIPLLPLPTIWYKIVGVAIMLGGTNSSDADPNKHHIYTEEGILSVRKMDNILNLVIQRDRILPWNASISIDTSVIGTILKIEMDVSYTWLCTLPDNSDCWANLSSPINITGPSLYVPGGTLPSGVELNITVLLENPARVPETGSWYHVLYCDDADLSLSCVGNCEEIQIRIDSGPECSSAVIKSVEWTMQLDYSTEINGTLYGQNSTTCNTALTQCSTVVPPGGQHFVYLTYTAKAEISAVDFREEAESDDESIIVFSKESSLNLVRKIDWDCMISPQNGTAADTFYVNCLQINLENVTYHAYVVLSSGASIELQASDSPLMNITNMPKGKKELGYNLTLNLTANHDGGLDVAYSEIIQVFPMPSSKVIDNYNKLISEGFTDLDMMNQLTETLLEGAMVTTNSSIMVAAITDRLKTIAIVNTKSVQTATATLSAIAFSDADVGELSTNNLADAVENVANSFVGMSIPEKETSRTTSRDILALAGNIMTQTGEQVLKIRSEADVIVEEETQNMLNQAKQKSGKMSAVVDNVVSVLASTLEQNGETLTMQTDTVQVQVSKTQSTLIANKSFAFDTKQSEETNSSKLLTVKIPNISKDIEEASNNSASVYTHVVVLPKNPYTWDASAENVNSPVVKVALKSDTNDVIKLMDTAEPFQMQFPLQGEKTSENLQLTAYLNSKTDMLCKSQKTMYFVGSMDLSLNRTSLVTISLEDSPKTFSWKLLMQNFKDDSPIPLANILKDGNPSEEEKSVTWILEKAEKGNLKKTFGLAINLPSGPCDVESDITKVVINVTVQTFSLFCGYFDAEQDKWSSHGCQISLEESDIDSVMCLCNHLTAFGAGILVLPNTIHPFEEGFLFATFFSNPVVVCTVVVIWVLYFVILVWARRKDKQECLKGGACILEDNDPDDKIVYLVGVVTGLWRNAGTTSNVFLQLHGTKSQSSQHRLSGGGVIRHFETGAEDWFVLTTPVPLGPMESVSVWHDNSGSRPSWFLKQIIVREIASGETTHFLYDNWLAVKTRCMQTKVIIPATAEKDLTKKTFFQFKLKTSQGMKSNHLWISIISCPPHTSFTRVQRLSCALSLLLCTMLTSILFHGIPTDDPEDQVSYGDFHFSLSDFIIGIESGLIVFPINFFIMQLFTRLKRRSCHKAKTAKDPTPEVSSIKSSDGSQKNTSHPKVHGFGSDDHFSDNSIPSWVFPQNSSLGCEVIKSNKETGQVSEDSQSAFKQGQLEFNMVPLNSELNQKTNDSPLYSQDDLDTEERISQSHSQAEGVMKKEIKDSPPNSPADLEIETEVKVCKSYSQSDLGTRLKIKDSESHSQCDEPEEKGTEQTDSSSHSQSDLGTGTKDSPYSQSDLGTETKGSQSHFQSDLGAESKDFQSNIQDDLGVGTKDSLLQSQAELEIKTKDSQSYTQNYGTETKDSLLHSQSDLGRVVKNSQSNTQDDVRMEIEDFPSHSQLDIGTVTKDSRSNRQDDVQMKTEDFPSYSQLHIGIETKDSQSNKQDDVRMETEDFPSYSQTAIGIETKDSQSNKQDDVRMETEDFPSYSQIDQRTREPSEMSWDQNLAIHQHRSESDVIMVPEIPSSSVEQDPTEGCQVGSIEHQEGQILESPDLPNPEQDKNFSARTCVHADDQNGRQDKKYYKESKTECEDTLSTKHKKSKCRPFLFPWWCVYVAWFLVISTSLVCSYLVMLYGLKYGYHKSVHWLLSFFTAFFQSAVVTQTLKVFVIAVLLTIIFKRPVEYDFLSQRKDIELGDTEEYAQGKLLQKQGILPAQEDKRQHTVSNALSKKVMAGIYSRLKMDADVSARFQELFLYFTFITIVLLIIHGHQNVQSNFLASQDCEAMFCQTSYGGSIDLEDVHRPEDMWAYLDDVIGEIFYPSNATETHLINGVSYLIGEARLRQKRIVQDPCSDDKSNIEDYFGDVICHEEFSLSEEDTASYNLSWKIPIDLDPSRDDPWTFQSALTLKTIPYIGQFSTYSGGGYVVKIQKSRSEVLESLKLLQGQNWIDAYTRAVFLEFTLFNPSVNLMSVGMILFEFTEIGQIFPWYQFFTSKLYHYANGLEIFLAICEALFVVYILFFTRLEIKKFRSLNKSVYFKDTWNYVECLIIVFGYITVILFIQKHVTLNFILDDYISNKEKFTSFYSAVFWDYMLTYIMAFLIFIVILKLLKLFNFIRRTSLLTTTLQIIKYPLANFAIIFSICMLAFASFARLVFGYLVYDFRDFGHTLLSLFSLLLGMSDFEGIGKAHVIFGPLFYFVFTFTVHYYVIFFLAAIVMGGFRSSRRSFAEMPPDLSLTVHMLHRLKLYLGLSNGKKK